MSEIDDWLTEAALRTSFPGSHDLSRQIEDRLAGPSPRALSSRRETTRGMLFAGLAALTGFATTGGPATMALVQPAAPTWVAAPPEASPFSLLVGR